MIPKESMCVFSYIYKKKLGWGGEIPKLAIFKGREGSRSRCGDKNKPFLNMICFIV